MRGEPLTVGTGGSNNTVIPSAIIRGWDPSSAPACCRSPTLPTPPRPTRDEIRAQLADVERNLALIDYKIGIYSEKIGANGNGNGARIPAHSR